MKLHDFIALVVVFFRDKRKHRETKSKVCLQKYAIEGDNFSFR